MADHRGDDAGPDARTGQLGDESEAFLAGRHLECATGGDSASAPGWAWLNRVAHGSRHDLARMGSTRCTSDRSGMTAFMAYLAAEVLATADSQGVPVETVQRTTLIPLELALSRRPSPPFGDAVRLAGDILAILEGQNEGQTR